MNQNIISIPVKESLEADVQDLRSAITSYIERDIIRPLFVEGEALDLLREFPDESIDCCMTSPPYWGHREYTGQGIGLELTHHEYINNLVLVLSEVKRVMKKTGSLWLNVGDTYREKQLLGIPWRIALELMDQHGFILRNSIIWHKVKGGPDNSKDKLRTTHENVFHFVKNRNYYYDIESIRISPRKATVENDKVISATGVSGVRYKRQIELSTLLSKQEKVAAYAALRQTLDDVRTGKISDFRMIIRGQQRTTHSDGETVSGRAKELRDKGFYFLKYHPNGTKPGDVWDILPEDTQKREGHYAAYPEDLCIRPILVSCPKDGVVLDPFCGTGTTMLVAHKLARKSIGLDISADYINQAKKRCGV